jgi:hypothetical protein
MRRADEIAQRARRAKAETRPRKKECEVIEGDERALPASANRRGARPSAKSPAIKQSAMRPEAVGGIKVARDSA